MEINLNLQGPQRMPIDCIKESYIRLLSPFKDLMGDKPTGLTSQPLMKGELFNRNVYNKSKMRILFVGRAVNGWEIDLDTPSIEEMVDRVFESASNVEDIGKGKFETAPGKFYNYNTSPFFQLCHAFLEECGLGEDWAKRFAWTNLYKIAPYRSGNPNNTLIGQTIDECAKILREEISHLRPTHIVFITGRWWYQPNGYTRSKIAINENAFADTLGVKLFSEDIGTIVGSGICKKFASFEPMVVVTNRPESSKMSRVEQAKEIIRAFENLQSTNEI